jgi:hypothetical protein
MWEPILDLLTDFIISLISVVVATFGSSIWSLVSEDFRLHGSQGTGEEELALFSWENG